MFFKALGPFNGPGIEKFVKSEKKYLAVDEFTGRKNN